MDNRSKGHFLIARKLFESEIWVDKPASWKVIWIYILGKVSHTKFENCDRGEGFFQWKEERQQVGRDISEDMIKKASSYFKKNGMISTRRSTRGVYIKVSKYQHYQSVNSYYGTSSSTKKALEKHSDRQEYKNVKNNIKNKEEPATTSVAGIPEILKIFEKKNPAIKRMYGNKTQRGACERLIREFGLDIVKGRAEFAIAVLGQPYAPRITTPYALELKWADLEAYYHSESGKAKKSSQVMI